MEQMDKNYSSGSLKAVTVETKEKDMNCRLEKVKI